LKHPNLIEYLAIAVEEEKPNVKFLVVEEYLGKTVLSLRALLERIADNQLLI
jgi:hypothetical protein